MDSGSNEITKLLKLAGDGHSQAAGEVLQLVYQELRKLAKSWMAHRQPGQTLQPTALVHEAFVRLMGRSGQQDWEGRRHFFFAASRAMRDILVENARAKGRVKRGGDRRRVDFENLCIAVDAPGEELLVLDDALKKMELEYPWEHRIVLLKFFAGMTNEEVAQAMESPLRTIERDWRFARSWLYKMINEDHSSGEEAS